MGRNRQGKLRAPPRRSYAGDAGKGRERVIAQARLGADIAWRGWQ
jgi:hypothetical protein